MMTFCFSVPISKSFSTTLLEEMCYDRYYFTPHLIDVIRWFGIKPSGLGAISNNVDAWEPSVSIFSSP